MTGPLAFPVPCPRAKSRNRGAEPYAVYGWRLRYLGTWTGARLLNRGRPDGLGVRPVREVTGVSPGVSMDELGTPPPPIEPGSTGHLHLCQKDHYWQHAGPTAEGCALPTFRPYTGVLSAAECAVCARRDDLLTRPPHSHRCGFCEVEWIHEGRCAEGLTAWCPWDFASPSGETAPGARVGRHRHHCPECGTHWDHLEPCAAQWQSRAAVLPRVRECQEALGRGVALGSRSPGSGNDRWRRSRHSRHRPVPDCQPGRLAGARTSTARGCRASAAPPNGRPARPLRRRPR